MAKTFRPFVFLERRIEMGLGVWGEEGNTQDLTFYFLPKEEQVLSGNAADTPEFLSEARFLSRVQPSTPPAETISSILPILFFAFVVFYGMGVIKL